MSANEPLVSQRRTGIGSERSFGLTMAAALAFIGIAPSLRGAALRVWALGLAVAFLLCALAAPRLLAPLNRLWHRLGLAMHAVLNPIVMALIFYGAILPTGLVLRLLDKDPLRLKWEPGAKSYWVVREPSGPGPGSMSKQF